jgi:hypothetical protein
MSDFQLKWLGLIMAPEPGNPHEAEGVLNPAVARAPDGRLYFFPRLVAADLPARKRKSLHVHRSPLIRDQAILHVKERHPLRPAPDRLSIQD